MKKLKGTLVIFEKLQKFENEKKPLQAKLFPFFFILKLGIS